MQDIIKIQNLNHYYQEGKKTKQVLFNITAEIHPREVVILTGESGSGKSTLLSLIGCLRSVQEGSLKVLGYELNGSSEKERIYLRRRLGYVFQHFNLLDFMNVEQNILVSLEQQTDFSPQEAVKKTREIIEAVGLIEHIKDYPRELSGGQKQRVAIARALVHRPPLLLADEPTASLDRRTGRESIELITSLAKEQGSAVLIVTHDNRIFGVGDRIIHIEDGQLNIGYKEGLSVALPGLTESQLHDLIPELTILTYQPGDLIIRQGDVSDKFYILIEGEADVIKEDENSPPKFLKRLHVNSYFGEVGLLHGVKRTATVRAADDIKGEIKVMAIDRSTFFKMMVDSDSTYAVLNYKSLKILTQDLVPN